MRHEAYIEQIEAKYHSLLPLMDERMRRQWAAAEARAYGWGGLHVVSAVMGMSPNTIRKGLAELVARENNPQAMVSPEVRRKGGGRKRRSEADPGLVEALKELVEPLTRGDPESALRWTCKSTTHLAEELGRLGHAVSPRTVGRLLNADGYSLQSNRKTREGKSHPDRNAQFEFINLAVQQWQQRGQPVISVDTKKKELVGPFKNGGREWQPKGEPQQVRVHDFLDKELGKAIPYGVYDLSANQGWVSVGIDHDTAQFAAQAIRRWWKKMGARRYGNARELLITADGGGSNASRSRLWKVVLQDLAQHLGMPIQVCHFPPGNQQMEQNRTSHVLSHYSKLAWSPAGQP